MTNLRMIVPTPIFAAVWWYSSVPENDYTTYVNGTAYAVGDRRIITTLADPVNGGTMHWVVDCIQAHTAAVNSANDPRNDIDWTTGEGAYWLRVGYTNRWKSYEGLINDQTVYAGDITGWFSVQTNSLSVAFFNTEAVSAEVKIYNNGTGLDDYVATKSCVETAGLIDWWTYFHNPAEYKRSVIFSMIPGYDDSLLKARVYGLSTNKLGEVIYGLDHLIGEMTLPIDMGAIDYSTKEFDTFGNPFITPRGYADIATFDVHVPAVSAERLKRLLLSFRAAPVVFYTDDDNRFGTTIYGLIDGVNIGIRSRDVATLTLKIVGMT